MNLSFLVNTGLPPWVVPALIVHLALFVAMILPLWRGFHHARLGGPTALVLAIPLLGLLIVAFLMAAFALRRAGWAVASFLLLFVPVINALYVWMFGFGRWTSVRARIRRSTEEAARGAEAEDLLSPSQRIVSGDGDPVLLEEPAVNAASGRNLEPTTVDPATPEAASADATAVDATSVERTSTEPTSIEPTSIEPTSIEPTSIEPTSIEPARDSAQPDAPSPPPGDGKTMVAPAAMGAVGAGVSGTSDPDPATEDRTPGDGPSVQPPQPETAPGRDTRDADVTEIVGAAPVPGPMPPVLPSADPPAPPAAPLSAPVPDSTETPAAPSPPSATPSPPPSPAAAAPRETEEPVVHRPDAPSAPPAAPPPAPPPPPSPPSGDDMTQIAGQPPAEPTSWLIRGIDGRSQSFAMRLHEADLLDADNGILIGRSNRAHFIINDESVSRNHARLVLIGGRLMVEDLDSMNGTWMGEARLAARSPAPLAFGTEFTIGKVNLRVDPVE